MINELIAIPAPLPLEALPPYLAHMVAPPAPSHPPAHLPYVPSLPLLIHVVSDFIRRNMEAFERKQELSGEK